MEAVKDDFILSHCLFFIFCFHIKEEVRRAVRQTEEEKREERLFKKKTGSEFHVQFPKLEDYLSLSFTCRDAVLLSHTLTLVMVQRVRPPLSPALQ